MPQQARSAYKTADGMPKRGTFACIDVHDAKAEVLIWSCEHVLRELKRNNMLSKSAMQRVSVKQVRNWLEFLGFKPIKHKDFDSSPPSDKDILSARKKLFGCAKKRYERGMAKLSVKKYAHKKRKNNATHNLR